MYKGITPTFTLTLPESVDLSTATNVYVTFADRKGTALARKTGDELEIDENVVSIYLDQSETLKFPGTIYIQINWTYNEGERVKRACSEIVSAQFSNNLEPRVLA